MRKLIFIPVVVCIFSCGSRTQIETGQLVPPAADSVAAPPDTTGKEDFLSTLKEISISNINRYIDPENGLRLVQSAGALPTMSSTSQVDKNFPVDFSTVKNEELPRVDCNSKTLWTKEGCYVQQINSFKEKKIWTYCGLNKRDEEKVAALAETISWTAINTAMHARYYFSRINGKWYLTFVDLISPCEA